MDTWTTLGIFLLGSGAGALLTFIFYSAQIRRLKQLVQATLGESYKAEQQDRGDDGDILKSA